MASEHEKFLRQAIELALGNIRSGKGGPFGALVVKDGSVIATGANSVTRTNDPSAHAEIVAIRAACQVLGAFQLTGCELYSSCEPCPMCLGAIYWARPKCYYFSASKEDAGRAQFDDSFIYRELEKLSHERAIPGYQLLGEEGARPFDEWLKSQSKISY